MYSSKEVLVVTTSIIVVRKIKRHLKPVTAHIVAGTNVFSDVLASFTDVFGGRSQTYQNQLTSLYDEAIQKIKLAAYELGANAVVGFSIDMDEISGKNKSMFMLTAIGTAVILEEDLSAAVVPNGAEKFANVSADRINVLHQKQAIVKQAAEDKLDFTDSTWEFITANRVEELFPLMLQKFKVMLSNGTVDQDRKFYKRILTYLEGFPEDKSAAMLYNAILNEDNELLSISLSNIIKELQLLHFDYVGQLIRHSDFSKQKRGVQIMMYDKLFYNKADVAMIEDIKTYLETNLKERGTRTTKKQLLSSKEKEVWVCECGRTNDVNQYEPNCEGCGKDIYGFGKDEIPLAKAIRNLDYKISVINQLVE